MKRCVICVILLITLGSCKPKVIEQNISSVGMMTAHDTIYDNGPCEMNINYVHISCSPNQEYELIGVPISDANKTAGYVFIKHKDDKIYKSLFFDKYDKYFFIISNNGEYIYQIDGNLGSCCCTDPAFDADIIVIKNFRNVDTINIGALEYLRRGFPERKNVFSFNADTIQIRDLGDQSYYINSNTAELVRTERIKNDSIRNKNYRNLNYKIEVKNVFERERLIKQLKLSK